MKIKINVAVEVCLFTLSRGFIIRRVAFCKIYFDGPPIEWTTIHGINRSLTHFFASKSYETETADVCMIERMDGRIDGRMDMMSLENECVVLRCYYCCSLLYLDAVIAFVEGDDVGTVGFIILRWC